MSSSALIFVTKGNGPARIAHYGGWVFIDIADLDPDEHGDPYPYIERAVDAAARHTKVFIVVRARNSRPPPAETREMMMTRFGGLGSRLACISVALEGGGFRQIAMQAFVAAARLLGVVELPVRTSKGLSDALDHALSVAETSAGAEPVPSSRVFEEFFGAHGTATGT